MLGGRVSAIDLPMMMLAVQATAPQRKRPTQMRGTDLNMVKIEAKIATV